MRFVLFYHSLVSDWNHGNAHFLRGMVRALRRRGMEVAVWEPEAGWSRTNLVQDQGRGPLVEFTRAFPDLVSHTYEAGGPDLDRVLHGADVVMVHEWTDPGLVRRIGRHRARGGRYRLLFHDTHHRAVTAPDSLPGRDLEDFDGILAFGEALRQAYLKLGWNRRVWTWHEAADTTTFVPVHRPRQTDVVWIGNWGDDERTAELETFLLHPVRSLGLDGTVHGVRYPPGGRAAVRSAGLRFGGWLPNWRVPEAFAAARVTVHVPRRPYARTLPGIPTIRVFEALACGIPLVSAPWTDTDWLFQPGEDYLVATDEARMTHALRAVLHDQDLAASLVRNGRRSILEHHTCDHRAAELVEILRRLDGGVATSPSLSR